MNLNNKYNWTDICNCIKQYDDIVILTHTNMDGDAMGSASALCHGLRLLGKRCVILLEDTVPKYLSVILHNDGEGSLPYFVNEMPFDAKLAIAVDCGDESRIEKRIDVFRQAEKTVCIDHHLQTGKFADYSVIDDTIAASGMLIFYLLKELGVIFDSQIAEDLFTAIATDTGRFKYSKTNAEVHLIVAELYQYGVDQVKICNAVFDSKPVSQLKAEGIAVENMKIICGGKAVVSHISLAEMESVGACYEQVDTGIDRIRLVDSIEYAAFLKEKDPGVVKLSVRAKSYGNANTIAKALGGGGHIKASGATLNMSVEDAEKLVIAEIEKEFAGE